MKSDGKATNFVQLLNLDLFLKVKCGIFEDLEKK